MALLHLFSSRSFVSYGKAPAGEGQEIRGFRLGAGSGETRVLAATATPISVGGTADLLHILVLGFGIAGTGTCGITGAVGIGCGSKAISGSLSLSSGRGGNHVEKR